jgi:DNA modification methylase
VTWDGDPGCRHVWGERIRTAITCGGNTGIAKIDGRDRPSLRIKKKQIDDRQPSRFCLRCGAWKGELGMEPTFDLYIKHLCGIFDEIRRVLKKTGTCWVVMGDTYGGSGQGWGKAGKRRGRNAIDTRPTDIMCTSRPPSYNAAPKSLCMIPSRFAIEMTDRGWILRNILVWWKSNAMPSSARDRFTVDYELVFFFTKSRNYYFEQQFEPWTDRNKHDLKRAMNGHGRYDGKWKRAPPGMAFPESKVVGNPVQGRNKRSVWNISTYPRSDMHFAVFPEALVETPLRAGCPEQVCRKCGSPRVKITTPSVRAGRAHSGTKYDTKTSNAGRLSERREAYRKLGYEGSPAPVVAGYLECACKAGFEPGVVLDPSVGSGTTCVVAERLGRNWMGIDVSGKYCEMARKRIARGLSCSDKVRGDMK